MFNEGYTARSANRWIRNELCDEAVRLGGCSPAWLRTIPRPSAFSPARDPGFPPRGPTRAERGAGAVMDQDRRRWDQLLVRRGLALIDRIDELPRHRRSVRAPGRDRRLPRPGQNGGRHRLAADRRALRRPRPDQPVARRGAEPRRRHWRAFGPQAGLDLVLPLFDHAAMRDYQPPPGRRWRPFVPGREPRRCPPALPAGAASPRTARTNHDARTRQRNARRATPAVPIAPPHDVDDHICTAAGGAPRPRP